ncbi:MAG TPA: hypothetical protein VIS94_01080 [Desulfomonilia bacterium]
MKLKCYFIILFIIIFFPLTVHSYNDKKTHRYITDVSIQSSDVYDYFKNILGFQKGYRDSVNGSLITKLIQDGAEHEDFANRAYNHFYNPLQEEGLDDFPFPHFRLYDPQTRLVCGTEYFFTGIPTLKWAMGTGCRQCCNSSNKSEDDNCNDYSWQRAMESYYQALTATSDRKRNDLFSAFFEKLGRVEKTRRLGDADDNMKLTSYS